MTTQVSTIQDTAAPGGQYTDTVTNSVTFSWHAVYEIVPTYVSEVNGAGPSWSLTDIPEDTAKSTFSGTSKGTNTVTFGTAVPGSCSATIANQPGVPLDLAARRKSHKGRVQLAVPAHIASTASSGLCNPHALDDTCDPLVTQHTYGGELGPLTGVTSYDPMKPESSSSSPSVSKGWTCVSSNGQSHETGSIQWSGSISFGTCQVTGNQLAGKLNQPSDSASATLTDYHEDQGGGCLKIQWVNNPDHPDKDITKSTGEKVLVGSYVELKVVSPTDASPDEPIKWLGLRAQTKQAHPGAGTVTAGPAVENYELGPSKVQVADLEDEQLNKQTVGFNWLTLGKHKITVSAKVGGKEEMADTTFQVESPEATMSATTCQVAMNTTVKIPEMGFMPPGVNYGWNDKCKTTPGIWFTLGGTAPTDPKGRDAFFASVQEAKVTITVNKKTSRWTKGDYCNDNLAGYTYQWDITNGPRQPAGGYKFDKKLPKKVASGGSVTWHTLDAPGVFKKPDGGTLNGTVTYVGHFVDYELFRPPGENSIYAPIRQLAWKFTLKITGKGAGPETISGPIQKYYGSTEATTVPYWEGLTGGVGQPSINCG